MRAEIGGRIGAIVPRAALFGLPGVSPFGIARARATTARSAPMS